MQEPEGNNNIEKLLGLICASQPNTTYLDSETFDIEQISEYDWEIKKDNITKKRLQNYLKKNKNLIKRDKTNTKFATVIGLNLGEGGHYGAIIFDREKNKAIVMDSMQIDEESGLTTNFNEIARLLFTTENNEIDIHNPVISYYLQPTGGFEKILVPLLEYSDLSKREIKEINYQHLESQNHFCYIWGCWMIHLYLSGYSLDKVTDKGPAILDIFSENNMIPFVALKRYILGFMPLLEKISDTELNEREFFYTHFPRIWSNHENEYELNFKLYSFNYNIHTGNDNGNDHVNNINEALQLSLDNYELYELKNTIVNEFLCKKH